MPRNRRRRFNFSRCNINSPQKRGVSRILKSAGVKKLVILALLLSVGVVLHAAEQWLIPPLPVPGGKLGIANAVTLAALLLMGGKETFAICVMRIFLGSFLGGTFLSSGFFLSLSGGLLSFSVMVLIYYASRKKANVILISIAGALAHNIGQLSAAVLIMKSSALFYYLPFLLLLAVPAGAGIGLLMKYLVPYLRRIQ